MITYLFYDQNAQLSESLTAPEEVQSDDVQIVLMSGDVHVFQHHESSDLLGVLIRDDGGLNVVNGNKTLLRAYGPAAWSWFNGEVIY